MASEGVAHSDPREVAWQRAALSVACVTGVVNIWNHLWFNALCSAVVLVWWRIAWRRRQDDSTAASYFFLSLAMLVPPPLYSLTSGHRLSSAIFGFSLAALAASAVAFVFDIRRTGKAASG